MIPRENHLLHLRFENGEERLFDTRYLFQKKPFQPIAEPEFFNKVRVMFGTISWPGELDISPELLYDNSTPITKN